MPFNHRTLFHEGNEKRPAKEKQEITQVSLPELQRDRVRAYLMVTLGQLKKVDESAEDLELQILNDLKFCVGKRACKQGVLDVPGEMEAVKKEVLALAETHVQTHTDAIRSQLVHRLTLTPEEAADAQTVRQAALAAASEYFRTYYHGVAYTLDNHLLHLAKKYEDDEHTIQLTEADLNGPDFAYELGEDDMSAMGELEADAEWEPVASAEALNGYIQQLVSDTQAERHIPSKAGGYFEFFILRHLRDTGKLTLADVERFKTDAAHMYLLAPSVLDKATKMILSGLAEGAWIRKKA